MFSGQGSQYYRMGVDLYARDPVFRDTMNRCSEQVSPALGTSLTTLLFQPRADRFAPFERTLYTHPALFSIQFSLAQSLLARGLRPGIILGYSLGEWVAHVVANVMPAETALDLLVRQATRLEADDAPGGMLAILESADLVQRHPEWFAGTWIAARNFDRHFVISGAAAPLAATEQRLKAQHVTVQRLPVLHAFHSPLMDRFQREIDADLRGIAFQQPSTPLFSCRGEEVTDANPVDALRRALREPVAFPDALSRLEQQGRPVYIDCGPAGTLSNFVKYGLPRDDRHRAVALMTPFDRNVENVEALCEARLPREDR